ncbi:DegT/DnrJ/EryC1/StrS family aminotransferase [Prochlorococcus marinus]|uniref:Erythromycin biosynthesis sensory transduction protein eryC1 n=1 Tax=Prochlorococcus marinus (strain AS9601) TaxID=146891 RepID=A2BSD4_PROMS|nr:DegT/DnrJ/EryC1/StrS family aminotransferase [Prochlorococcus marinus]ABM70695.1 Hypothetical protein A9601_14111 [Prochlorococcus marinus str. AS9601]
MKNIPILDLNLQHLNLQDEIFDAFKKVINKSSFIRGEYVDSFENEFAKLTGRKHCISCANGTDALYIAMHAMNLKNKEEVIVPAHSWISTSETVTQAGGKVVFCDTNVDDFTINTDLIESKITEKTVGIIPVHLYGQPANMSKIKQIAKKYSLWIIEDCAQAHFAEFKNLQVGSFGEASTFSFYPGKNLGALGDAGAIVTDNDEVAYKLKTFARHGGLLKGDHQIEGINSRMDGLQAAFLLIKMKYINKWTDQRIDKANNYFKLLNDIPNLTLPVVNKGNKHVWHLFVIKHAKRDELSIYLKGKGISTSINYPIALPFLPAYKYLNHSKNDFPAAYENQSKILSIPLYPELTLDQQSFISKNIIDFCI